MLGTRRTIRIITAHALAALACAHAARAQNLYGIRYEDGVLFSISTIDASTTIIGTTTASHPEDLLLASDGFLYAVTGNGLLSRIDPTNAATTSIGLIGFTVYEGALATDSNGVTYGLNANLQLQPDLFRIDLSTGVGTVIGPLSFPPLHDINGAVFRSDGALVAIDRITNALVQIDPATGVTTVIQALMPTSEFVGGLAVSGGVGYFNASSSGGVGAAPDDLWQIDLFTGAQAYVGSFGQPGFLYGISGLAGIPPNVGTLFCFGDGSGAACPCGNASAAADQVGCLHSFGFGGRLRAHGDASVTSDTFLLEGTSMANGPTLYFQGTAPIASGAGIAFGDGLRCVAGTVIRLGTEQNSGGASRYPQSGDPSVSVRGMVPAGSTRHYQAWFRNAASFCTTSTFNLTNGVTIVWS